MTMQQATIQCYNNMIFYVPALLRCARIILTIAVEIIKSLLGQWFRQL